MKDFTPTAGGQTANELVIQAMRDYQRQRQMTLGDLLLENRVIFLQGEIYDGNANELVMKLLYLQSENRRKEIHSTSTRRAAASPRRSPSTTRCR